MRRYICLLLIISMLLFAACGGNPPDDTADPTSSATGSSSATQSGTSSAPSDTTPEPSQTGKGAQGNTQKTEPSSTKAQGNTAKPTTTKPSTKATVTTAGQQIKSVTIPEGYTFWQIAQKLEHENICTAKAFFNAAQGYDVQSFSVPKDNDVAYRYEGYLFPDTYELYTGEDPVDVLKKMLNNYAAKSGMPDRKTLILASIIEREVRSTDQMALVSSVFHNRVNRGAEQGIYTLGSDPTREYVEKYIVQSGTLIKNPDRFRTLYNTYRPLSEFNSKNSPLPAGPICNPGIRAINAAKNPAKSDYFYFFFSKDNVNHYSKTYQEHQNKIKEFGVGDY